MATTGIRAIMSAMTPKPGQHEHQHAGGGGVADAAAHRLPAGMADIDGVDEGVAHQAADQADDAVGGQHRVVGKRVAGRRGALDIVHRLDEVVDAERDGGDQDDADELEAAKDVIDRRHRDREAEMRESGAAAPRHSVHHS